MNSHAEQQGAAALGYARAMAEAGIPVFVVHPATERDSRKIRRIGWKMPPKWETTTANPRYVDAWRPGLALCAVMGHGLDLVDVDPRNGADLAVLNGTMPTTYGVAATPSGGWHGFVKSMGVRSRDNVAPGIDVKAGDPDGQGRGFAFISPTVRASKITGELVPYRWTTPPDLDALKAAADDHSGEKLAALVRAAHGSRATAADDAFSWDNLTGPWDDITGTLTEGRHRGVVRLASALRGRGGWRTGDALAYMRAAVWPLIDQAQGGHPYTEAEFEADITDVFTRYPDGPSTGAAGPANAVMDHEPVTSGTDTPPAADPVDPDEQVRRNFPAIDWEELWADDEGEDWILEPLIPARRLIALYSAPKVGKSLLMLEIAVGVANGVRTLGVLPDQPRRVLYVDHENDPRGDVRTRLEDMGYKPADLTNLCYLSYPVMDGLDSAVGARQLLDAARVYECGLVVIDTISRAVQGDENDNDTWLRMFRLTGKALKAAGVAMVRLDHTGKDDAKGMRGGSAKYGDVDAVWKLTRETDTMFKLVCTDHRFRVAEKEIILTRSTGPLRHKVEGGGWSVLVDARFNAVMDALANTGLPADAGRDRARKVVKAAGIEISNAQLGRVLEHRKTCPNLSRTGVDHRTCPDPSRTGADRWWSE